MRRLRGACLVFMGIALASCASLLLDFPRAHEQEPSSPGATVDEPFDAVRASRPAATRLALLEGNPDAWVARWRLLDGARHRIDVVYFILSQDVFGLAFLGHLWKQAEAGVTVRLLIDAEGERVSERPDGLDCLPVLASARRASVKRFRPVGNRLFDALVTLTPAALLPS